MQCALAKRLRRDDDTEGKLRDDNGNTVGIWEITT